MYSSFHEEELCLHRRWTKNFVLGRFQRFPGIKLFSQRAPPLVFLFLGCLTAKFGMGWRCSTLAWTPGDRGCPPYCSSWNDVLEEKQSSFSMELRKFISRVVYHSCFHYLVHLPERSSCLCFAQVHSSFHDEHEEWVKSTDGGQNEQHVCSSLLIFNEQWWIECG